MIELARNTTASEDILKHLKACDASFSPVLSSRVSLADYARKLADRAHRLEAWQEGKLVGLIATYLGSDRRAFISNVSVDSCVSGQGIGAQLMVETLADAQSFGIDVIALEVSTEATAALRLYRKFGFLFEAKSKSESTDVEMCVLSVDL